MDGIIAIDKAEKGHWEMLSSNVDLTLPYPTIYFSTIVCFF